MCAISDFEYAYQLSHQKEAVSNAKFETASLGLTRGIGRFDEEASFSAPKVSPLLGHTRGKTVINSFLALSCRFATYLYTSRGRKRR